MYHKVIFHSTGCTLMNGSGSKPNLAMILSHYWTYNAIDENNNISVGGFEDDSNTYMQLGVLGLGRNLQ